MTNVQSILSWLALGWRPSDSTTSCQVSFSLFKFNCRFTSRLASSSFWSGCLPFVHFLAVTSFVFKRSVNVSDVFFYFRRSPPSPARPRNLKTSIQWIARIWWVVPSNWKPIFLFRKSFETLWKCGGLFHPTVNLFFFFGKVLKPSEMWWVVPSNFLSRKYFLNLWKRWSALRGREGGELGTFTQETGVPRFQINSMWVIHYFCICSWHCRFLSCCCYCHLTWLLLLCYLCRENWIASRS